MDNPELQSGLDDVIPRWVYLIGAFGLSLAAVYSMWEHGLRNWDWAQDAFLAFIFFSFSFRLLDPAATRQSWRSRIFWIAYGILFGAWIGHEYGWWIPGGCFAVVSIASGWGAAKRSWWHPLPLLANIALLVGLAWIAHRYGLSIPLGCLAAYLVATARGAVKRDSWHPLSVIKNVALIVGFIWIVARYGLWIPVGCVAAGILLLQGTSDYRKSFTEYLRQLRVVAAMAVVLVAVLWASRHPSFWTIVAPIIILALMLGDAWVYASPRKESFALPHPQS